MELGYAPAGAEDIDVLYEFNRELIDRYEDPDSIDMDEVFAWVRRKLEKCIGEYTCVTADSEKAGYFRFHDRGVEMELDDLYIFPEFRGRGIMTEVIKRCCAQADKPVMLYVFAENTRAVALYERHGFEIAERVGGTRYIMRREKQKRNGEAKMKEIEIFYLTGCPYCMKARKAVGELAAENPAYADITIKWIEENEQPLLANSRDYYNVPSVFFRGEKLYEAKPTHGYETIKESIKAAFDKALTA